MPRKALAHLNQNILCAFSIRTTGIRPYYHDLYEVAILPLDAQMKVGEFLPFHAIMQLKRPENLTPDRVRQIDMVKIASSLDSWTIAELFETWIERLKLPFRKKIVPICYNWGLQRAFIMDWLNETAYDNFIDDQLARDIRATALYIDDKADYQNEPIPFAKVNFRYIFSSLKIEIPQRNDCMWECVAIGEAYYRMLSM